MKENNFRTTPSNIDKDTLSKMEDY